MMPRILLSLSILITLWPLLCRGGEAFVLDRILAVVNGEVISLSDVERHLTFFGNLAPPGEEGFSRSIMQQGIQELINQKLLIAEAERFAVEEPTEKQIQEALKGIKGRFGSPEEFQTALQRNAMSIEDLQEMIRARLRVDRFIDQRIRFFVIVLPDEISRYYTENQQAFQGKPYEEAEKTIEKLLFEKKTKAKLEDFLSKLKASIQINLE